MSSHNISGPTAKDILRYRSHHGVNLGGIFVLERWLFPNMFDSSVAGDSEHDAVVSSLNNIGLEATRQKWQSHWSSVLTESDLNYLTTVARVNNLRLPIGYFTLGSAFTNQTPFAMLPSQVYVNAWSAVCNLIRRAHAHGISVLIDLHALPGGANAELHSGTSSSAAELWGNDFNLALAKRCLIFIAQELKDRGLGEGAVGIQLCNEAIYDAPGLYKWYDDVISSIAAIDPSIPVYISDAWDLPRALNYSLRKNTPTTTLLNPIIIDTHRYYNFAAHDTSRPPRKIIDQISSTELSELAPHVGNVFNAKTAVGVFVGEWSCVLDMKSWRQVPESQRAELTRQFGRSQIERWRKVPGVGGNAFWMLKQGQAADQGDDWSFKQHADNGTGALTAPAWLKLSKREVLARLEAAEPKREGRKARATEDHSRYWDSMGTGRFEHWRFADGWNLGWCDARDFFKARIDGVVPTAASSEGQAQANDTAVVLGADRMGFLELWVLKRMREAGVDKARCEFGWEWEHGFRKGVRDFEELVRIEN